MNFLSRTWHKLVGQKQSVVRVLDEVAKRLEASHPETICHLNNAFHPVDEKDLEAIRPKGASDLRTAIATVKGERHAEDDAFESPAQHASLAQSTLNEQFATLDVTHQGVGDDLDAFFNKYGPGDLGAETRAASRRIIFLNTKITESLGAAYPREEHCALLPFFRGYYGGWVLRGPNTIG